METDVKLNPAGVKKLREFRSSSGAGIVAGSASPEQAATALGILGAFAGIVGGALGVLSQRATTHASRLAAVT